MQKYTVICQQADVGTFFYSYVELEEEFSPDTTTIRTVVDGIQNDDELKEGLRQDADSIADEAECPVDELVLDDAASYDSFVVIAWFNDHIGVNLP